MAKAISSKSSGKLTKKELKQDKLVELTYKLEKFYLEHQKWVIAAVVAVVVIVAGVILIRKTMESSRLQESYQLTLAKMNYGAGKTDEARDAFQRIVSSQSGRAAGEARYFLGRIAYDKGNFADAATAFSAYIKDFASDDEMECAAMAGLAGCYEAQNKTEDAAKTYMEIAVKFPQSSFAAQALWEASRVYMSINQNDAAKKALQTIRDKYNESILSPQAKRMLENLG
jgi:TolA-binding protein